jgi:hypothetical protein
MNQSLISINVSYKLIHFSQPPLSLLSLILYTVKILYLQKVFLKI